MKPYPTQPQGAAVQPWPVEALSFTEAAYVRLPAETKW